MKRRSFIKQSCLASAAVVSSQTVFSNVLYKSSSSSPIKVGVIGTGNRGCGLISIINSINNLSVSACCDILPLHLKEGISKADTNPKGYIDYRKLLDDKTIDAVIVATPFSTHSKIAIDALDAGKHVYCEKTLAKGYEAIQNLINKANCSDTIFQTGHQYHSSRLYLHVVNMIKSGDIGKISVIECQWNRYTDWRKPVEDPSLERLINWRMYKEYSGGLVAELCSHQIDFSNWVLEDFPEKVVGVGGIDYWKDGRETYDNVHLIYTYPNGVKATYTCLTDNAINGYRIKVIGDKGTIVINDKNAWLIPVNSTIKEYEDVDGVSGATTQWDSSKGIPIEIEHAEPSKQALLDFSESILNNTVPLSNIRTGADTAICVQMGLDAMYNDEVICTKDLPI